MALVQHMSGTPKSTSKKGIAYPWELQETDLNRVKEFLGLPANVTNTYVGQTVQDAALAFSLLPEKTQAEGYKLLADSKFSRPLVCKEARDAAEAEAAEAAKSKK